MKAVIVALRALGLSVNSKKTEICPGYDTNRIDELINDGSAEVQQLDTMWASNSPSVITRSIPVLKSLTERLIESGQIDSRDFRFCIKRWEKLALCPAFSVPDEVYRPITDAVAASVADFPASTDQFTQFLRAAPTEGGALDVIRDFLTSPERAIYPWQNYRLWLLLTEKQYTDGHLLPYATKVIASDADEPDKAGAVLYAGALGGNDERTLIARNFKFLKSFLAQRSALIALQELPFEPAVRDHVKLHVRDDLLGVYRRLNQESQHRYCTSAPEVRIGQIADADTEYE